MDSAANGSGWTNRIGALFDGRSRIATGAFNRREPWGRVVIAALIIAILLGPLLTFADAAHANEGNIERQLAFFALLGLTVYVSIPVATRWSMVALSWPVMLALAWAWLSLTWAIDPAMAFRRLFLTTIVVWMVFALVRHVGYRSTVDMLRWTLFGAVVTSYFVVLLSPVTGIHLMLESEGPTALIGNWRGWLGHKNFAGAVAAVCILLFLFDAKRFRPAVRIGVIIVAGFFLFKSQSKTSAGMLGLASLAGIIFTTLSYKARAYLLPILTLLGCALWFLTSFYSNLLQASFADPASFTGRGNIWAALLRYASDNLMFGAGFGSFWNIGGLSPIYKYGSGYVTQITIGHSGFLDQLVTVGLPGLLLMVLALMIWPLWKLLSNPSIPPERGALISSLTLFCIGHNITESSLFERDAIVATLLYFAAALAQYCTVPDGYLQSGTDGNESFFKAMRDRRNALAAAARTT